MVEKDLFVKVSPAALSSLLFENARCKGSPKNQIGFLLGEIVTHVTQKVTDATAKTEVIERYIVINTVAACPAEIPLFDSIGRIKREVVRNLLRDKEVHVIGWFRYRDFPLHKKSLRDLNIHSELSNYFHEIYNYPKDHFIWCLLTSVKSEIGGIHRMRHVIMRRRGRSFQPLSMRVNNLGSNQKPGLSDQVASGYKKIPMQNPMTPLKPDIFNEFVQSLNLDLSRTCGLELLKQIEGAAQQKMRDIIPRICDSDETRNKLLKELNELLFKDFITNYEENKKNCTP